MEKLDIGVKQDIIKKFKEGVKVSKIAICYGVSKVAVYNVIKNYQKFGQSSIAIKTVGRKKLETLSNQERELYVLKKENADLKMQLEIRNLHQAFFEKQTKDK